MLPSPAALRALIAGAGLALDSVLLARFAVQGYDTAQFRHVPQSPEQIGKPGFQ